jgi:hypothetical protein
MDDILKEAIADAKALRATALENAKIALEEAFTPRLKNMLSQKIQSEVEGEDEVEERMYDEDEVEDGHGEVSETEHEDEVAERMHDEDDDEVAERMHDEDEDEVKEAEHMEDEGEHMEDEDEHMETEVEDEMSDEGEHMEDEDGHMEDEGEHMEDEGEHMEDEDEDELDLESVIKELEEELDTSAVGDSENKEPSDSASDSSAIGQGPEAEGSDKDGGKENSDDEDVKEKVMEAEESEMSDEDEEIDLDEVIKALSEEEGMEDEEEEESVDEMKTTLKEYKDTIGFLREKLNEVNLLNAKLLFTNKLFRGFGLNNNQKLSVVEQFDRTKNLREIKLVYTTLAESFQGNGNKRVNESKGQASKPVQSTAPKKEVISEGAEMKNRFKKLANLV